MQNFKNITAMENMIMSTFQIQKNFLGKTEKAQRIIKTWICYDTLTLKQFWQNKCIRSYLKCMHQQHMSSISEQKISRQINNM